MSEPNELNARGGHVHANWRSATFPALVAFASGVLVATIVNGGARNAAGAVFVIAALLGLGYGLAHLFVASVIAAGRIKRRGESIASGDTPDDEWVDEVVHPDP